MIALMQSISIDKPFHEWQRKLLVVEYKYVQQRIEFIQIAVSAFENLDRTWKNFLSQNF